MINKLHRDQNHPWKVSGSGSGMGMGSGMGYGNNLEQPMIVDENKGFGAGWGKGNGSGMTYPWRETTIAEIGFPGEGTGFGTCLINGMGH